MGVLTLAPSELGRFLHVIVYRQIPQVDFPLGKFIGDHWLAVVCLDDRFVGQLCVYRN